MKLYIPASYFDNWKPENQTVSNAKVRNVMTPERAKELLPIIQAFSEGKQVQVQDSIDKKWRTIINPAFDSHSIYRIKPEVVRYRRFIIKAGGKFLVVILHLTSIIPEEVESNAGFVRWIDTDWVEEEV